jgi:hypothetical protein
MNNQSRWTAFAGALLLAAVAGIVSYNAGVSHGLAIAVGPAGAVVPDGGYRPWGFGPIGPLAVLGLFWFLVLRFFFWGGFGRRRWYSAAPCDGSSPFEEWHRRAHERMNEQPPARPESRA